MNKTGFFDAFAKLTGNSPFPWQWDLYQLFLVGNFPRSCSLPTGLGKTSVIHVWLLALAYAPTIVPRRLVYVVNRRTVVDQSTEEAKKLRNNLPKVPDVQAKLGSLAISTLRGQFADNREWSADPSRPAVIVGTVDMIGSRLLFSGYGIGFKSKPLHAGFLAQDVLLVHDEAHLEPAFQKLLIDIEEQQHKAERTGELPWRKLRVMELSATSRGSEKPFELTEEEKTPPEQLPDEISEPIHVVWRRLRSKKAIAFHKPESDKENVADRIAKLAKKYSESHPGSAILVFVSSLEDHATVCKALKGEQVQVLTGTLRGLERDRMADPRKETGCRIFARFLKPPKPEDGEKEQWKIVPTPGTVYLVCTSAGEVGIDISADHLVCDLTTFDRMAQRFGRVNRFGTGDANIDIVHEHAPDEKNKDDSNEQARWITLELLKELPQFGERWSASPLALMLLRQRAELRKRNDVKTRVELAYTPHPTILPVSDILFDTWTLTTIRGKLPGRPLVEPYLHGISSWEPPETYVAWREEVGVITPELRAEYNPEDLLDDYPLKPHELLRDNSSRVFDRLKKLTVAPDTPVWVLAGGDSISVTTLGRLIEAGKDELSYKTVLLPPSAGGLENGMLVSDSKTADDAADEWLDENRNRRRVRVWDGDSRLNALRNVMRLVRRIDFPAPEEDEDAEGRSWHWFELPSSGDGDGSKMNKKPVTWQVHTDDVTNNASGFLERLRLSADLQQAVLLAAKCHDLGKKREVWQRSIGNPDPKNWLGKSGGKMKPRELTDYRHEFGSLLDVLDPQQPFLAELKALSDELQEVVLHLIAVHHGLGRPHFPRHNAFDPSAKVEDAANVTAKVPQRFARLQRKYGRWGLAYLESLLRAADYAASANPSAFVEEQQ